MFCHQCGKQVPDAARFCPYCAAILAEPEKMTPEMPVQQPSAYSGDLQQQAGYPGNLSEQQQTGSTDPYTNPATWQNQMETTSMPGQISEGRKPLSAGRKVLIALVILVVITLLGVGGKYGYDNYLYPYLQYQKAAELVAEENYADAIPIYRELGEYKDVQDLLTEAIYQYGRQLENSRSYAEAITQYQLVEEYKDSIGHIKECRYQIAQNTYGAGEYAKARGLFEELIPYKDCWTMVQECDYCIAKETMDAGEMQAASEQFLALGDYKDSHTMYLECIYVIAKDERESGNYEGCMEHLELLIAENYSDSYDYLKGMITELAQLFEEKHDTDPAAADRYLAYLCEFGYFTYEPLPMENREQMLEMVEPVSLSIREDTSNGSYNFGTGAIYRIDPDYIYVATVKHVVRPQNGHKVTLTFYDGTKKMIRMQGIYSQEKPKLDFAMFRFPTAEVPPQLLLTLKQLYYDPAVYDELTEGTQLVIHANMWGGHTDKIFDTEYIGDDVWGETHEYVADPNNDMIVTSHCAIGGQSGGPIFDLKGRCVALVRSSYYEGNNYRRDLQVKLLQAEELFERRSEMLE
ncbi:MAG: zinc-ribbon domain-containing protein [Lachnospiraceae bacterium]|nr:zinc-ribbon domain-containing protein [Lachnospiraceae bacterium]